MTIEELKITNEDINLLKEMKENCLKASVYKDEKRLLKANAITKFLVEHQEKQELIDYLKDLLENRYTNSKVVWFDSEYAKIYGELCTMAGANDDRLPLVPLSEIENILSKIEKSDK